MQFNIFDLSHLGNTTGFIGDLASCVTTLGQNFPL